MAKRVKLNNGETHKQLIDSNKMGLYIVKHGKHFFLFNIEEKSSIIDDYDEEPRDKVDELYFIYALIYPGSNEDLNTLIDKIKKDEYTRRSCRMIHLIKYRGNFIAKSKQIVYNPGCSIGHGLERGVGSRDMMFASIYLCKKVFGVDKFYLSDKSMRNKVSVQAYSFLTSGKSWYEKHFQAQPCISDSDIWDINRNQYKSTIRDDQISMIERSFRIHNDKNSEYFNQFKHLFKSDNENINKTWELFLNGYQRFEESLNEFSEEKVLLFDDFFIKRAVMAIGFQNVVPWFFDFKLLEEALSNTVMFKTCI